MFIRGKGVGVLEEGKKKLYFGDIVGKKNGLFLGFEWFLVVVY